MMAYAQPPCDVGLQPNESGNMYISAYDSGGNDIIDTGLGTNISQSTQGGNLGRMVAFTTPYNAGDSGHGWTNQAQTYPCGQPPSSLLQNPTTWNGIGSNCGGCSVGRMTTIAQPTLSYDGSCYGYCTSAGGDAFWIETVAGRTTVWNPSEPRLAFNDPSLPLTA